jgi:hypothetical protein
MRSKQSAFSVAQVAIRSITSGFKTTERPRIISVTELITPFSMSFIHEVLHVSHKAMSLNTLADPYFFGREVVDSP